MRIHIDIYIEQQNLYFLTFALPIILTSLFLILQLADNKETVQIIYKKLHFLIQFSEKFKL